jgi:hypothetical protein
MCPIGPISINRLRHESAHRLAKAMLAKGSSVLATRMLGKTSRAVGRGKSQWPLKERGTPSDLVPQRAAHRQLTGMSVHPTLPRAACRGYARQPEHRDPHLQSWPRAHHTTRQIQAYPSLSDTPVGSTCLPTPSKFASVPDRNCRYPAPAECGAAGSNRKRRIGAYIELASSNTRRPSAYRLSAIERRCEVRDAMHSRSSADELTVLQGDQR